MREEAVVGSNMFQVQTQQTGLMRCAIDSLITQMELSRYGGWWVSIAQMAEWHEHLPL